jgi:hypothetical protein
MVQSLQTGGWSIIALEQERRVGAPKPKAIRKRVSQTLVPRGFVRNKVEVALRVGILVVDRWRQNLMIDGETSDGCLEPSRSAKQRPVMDFVALMASL